MFNYQLIIKSVRKFDLDDSLKIKRKSTDIIDCQFENDDEAILYMDKIISDIKYFRTSEIKKIKIYNKSKDMFVINI